MMVIFTLAEASENEGTKSREGDEEGDRKEPLRFESLEVTSLEQSVPDHVIKTYDEVETRREFAHTHHSHRWHDNHCSFRLNAKGIMTYKGFSFEVFLFFFSFLSFFSFFLSFFHVLPYLKT